jgi:pimeloyl-ACP methyl ester carboxylesterase
MPTAAGLHYFAHEDGNPTRPPLVLIHDISGSHLSWPPEIRRLPDFRVFSLDLPGHGKTPGPGLQSVRDYGRRVVEFLDGLKLSRAVLAGHGMGGAVAQAVALDKPERVAGIALISSGARLPIASSILENAANTSTLPLALKALCEIIVGPQAPDSLAQAIQNNLNSARQALIYGDLLACDGFDAANRLDAIRAPALVICGTDDRLAPVRFSEALASGIPGAALQTIDGAGHMVMLEQPRRLAALLNVFLRIIPYLPGM